jgi:hypothetical protein
MEQPARSWGFPDVTFATSGPAFPSTFRRRALDRASGVAVAWLGLPRRRALAAWRLPPSRSSRRGRRLRDSVPLAVPLLALGLLAAHWLGAEIVPPPPRLSAQAAIERVQDTPVPPTSPTRGQARLIEDLISERTGTPEMRSNWSARFDGRGWLVTCRTNGTRDLRFAWWVPDDGPGVFAVNDYASLLTPDVPRLGAAAPGPGLSISGA